MHRPGQSVHLCSDRVKRRQQCLGDGVCVRARARVSASTCDRDQMECQTATEYCSYLVFCFDCRVCASIIIIIVIERAAFSVDCKCHSRNKCNLWRHWLTHLWAHLNASNPFKTENTVEFLPHFLHSAQFCCAKKTFHPLQFPACGARTASRAAILLSFRDAAGFGRSTYLGFCFCFVFTFSNVSIQWETLTTWRCFFMRLCSPRNDGDRKIGRRIASKEGNQWKMQSI